MIYSAALDVWAPYQYLTNITHKNKNRNHVATHCFDAKDQRVHDVIKEKIFTPTDENSSQETFKSIPPNNSITVKVEITIAE